jgi:hypothetical protein
MEPKLFNYYSIDECTNEEKLYSELDKFVDNGALQYKLQERHILKMSDLDLTEDDIEKISNLFDALDVFPYLDLHDDEDDFHEDDYGDDEY